MYSNFTPFCLLPRAVLPVFLILLTGLTACDAENYTLRMHMRSHMQFEPEAIQSIFADQSSIRLIQVAPSGGNTPLDSLVANEADLATVENSTTFVPGVRAVLPIYRSVVHVLVRQDFVAEDPAQPLRNAAFFIVNQSVAGNAFVDLITRRQGLEEGEYRKLIAPEPGTADIIIYLGPIDASDTLWYQPGYKLVSPGRRFGAQGRGFEESVGYIAPNTRPTVIPAFTYDLPGNDEPLMTLAVNTLLVARKEVPEAVIYEFTRTLLEQKPRFTSLDPYLFGGIHESFDPLDLSFPLHDGARRYLERNEPGLLERYAESINTLAYLFALLVTGFLAVTRWRAQRKKDRIDDFYVRVLAVRERIGGEDPADLLNELAALEKEAFLALVSERLAANESFRIFTDLLSLARAELQSMDS